MAHGHRDFTPHGRALVLVLWWLGHILQRKRKVHLALVCPVPSMRRPDRRMPCVRSTAVKTQKSKLILSDELLRFSWYAGGGGAGGYTPLRPHVQPPPGYRLRSATPLGISKITITTSRPPRPVCVCHRSPTIISPYSTRDGAGHCRDTLSTVMT